MVSTGQFMRTIKLRLRASIALLSSFTLGLYTGTVPIDPNRCIVCESRYVWCQTWNGIWLVELWGIIFYMYLASKRTSTQYWLPSWAVAGIDLVPYMIVRWTISFMLFPSGEYGVIGMMWTPKLGSIVLNKIWKNLSNIICYHQFWWFATLEENMGQNDRVFIV